MAFRILLVDDEEAVLTATREYLGGLGYEVDVAGEREEAEALLATGRYDLVISDLHLTGVHGREGLELVGYVRERCPATQMVLLTAYGSADLEEEVQRHGVAAVLTKPQPLAHVAELASRLLEARP